MPLHELPLDSSESLHNRQVFESSVLKHGYFGFY